VQHRPLSHRGQLFQEGQIMLDVARHLGNLNDVTTVYPSFSLWWSTSLFVFLV
jgi:hypothetical protein